MAFTPSIVHVVAVLWLQLLVKELSIVCGREEARKRRLFCADEPSVLIAAKEAEFWWTWRWKRAIVYAWRNEAAKRRYAVDVLCQYCLQTYGWSRGQVMRRAPGRKSCCTCHVKSLRSCVRVEKFPPPSWRKVAKGSCHERELPIEGGDAIADMEGRCDPVIRYLARDL